MKLSIFDGLYPTNPIWANDLLIILFELTVIGIEISIITYNWDWVVKHRRHAILMIIVANLVSFGFGALIQFLLGGF
jgi:hypothetical protein